MPLLQSHVSWQPRYGSCKFTVFWTTKRWRWVFIEAQKSNDDDDKKADESVIKTISQPIGIVNLHFSAFYVSNYELHLLQSVVHFFLLCILLCLLWTALFTLQGSTMINKQNKTKEKRDAMEQHMDTYDVAETAREHITSTM